MQRWPSTNKGAMKSARQRQRLVARSDAGDTVALAILKDTREKDRQRKASAAASTLVASETAAAMVLAQHAIANAEAFERLVLHPLPSAEAPSEFSSSFSVHVSAHQI